MILSLSTLNWLTFPAPSPADAHPKPPFSSAPFREVLDAAVEAGFTTVGLDAVALGDELTSEEGRAAIATELRDRGLHCSDLGVLRVGQANGLDSARLLGSLAAELRAQGAGSPVCSAIVDAPLTPTVVEQVVACAAVLASFDCRMAVEFMAYGPLGRLADAVALCDAVGWSRSGLLLDSWHLAHSGASWAEVAALPPERIALVQASDGAAVIDDAGTFFTESRWGRRAPGDGALDVAGFAAALRGAGYDGVVSAEILSFAARFGEAREAASIIHSSLQQTFGG